ncbi:MAG: hypothetical protein ACPGQS_10475, partial [Bradymonadia bacterium]
ENNHWRLTWGWVAFKKATTVDSTFFAEARAGYPTTVCGIFDLACWDALYASVINEAGATLD